MVLYTLTTEGVDTMAGDIGGTQFFKVDVEKETSVKIILEMVCEITMISVNRRI